jgi:hypothetical protein
MNHSIFHRLARRTGTAAIVLALGACSGLGLGNVLGGVLGGQGSQVVGAVQSVDTRSRQIGVQQSNGQTVWVGYDGNTQVVFQNQNYPITALQRGDQVTANVQDNGNGAYYTNLVQVTQSVSGSRGTSGSNLQSFQGTVRQVDRSNGWFTMDESNLGRITVTLPSGLSQNDINRFNNLRVGDNLRFYGTRYGNNQVQLRQF